jgi:redox-sensitive bicupin YhaK (pirin superfamily)
LQVATGQVKADGVVLEAGSALGFIRFDHKLVIEALDNQAHVLLFDLRDPG